MGVTRRTILDPHKKVPLKTKRLYINPQNNELVQHTFCGWHRNLSKADLAIAYGTFGPQLF